MPSWFMAMLSHTPTGLAADAGLNGPGDLVQVNVAGDYLVLNKTSGLSSSSVVGAVGL